MSELSLGRCRVTPGFLLGAALLLFLEEDHRLTLLFLIAALCHEGGHILAAKCCGLTVRSVRLSAVGMELDIPRGPHCSYGQELLLLAAGPAVNLALTALCCRLSGIWPKLFGGINLILACFNLLPVSPLDGGELFRLCCSCFCSPRLTLHLTDGLAGLTCGSAIGAGLWLAWLGNPSLLLLGIWLLLGRMRCRV